LVDRADLVSAASWVCEISGNLTVLIVVVKGKVGRLKW
jgi:hypothetical protein